MISQNGNQPLQKLEEEEQDLPEIHKILQTPKVIEIDDWGEFFKKRVEQRTSNEIPDMIKRQEEFPFFEKSYSKIANPNPDYNKGFQDFIHECSKYLVYEYFEPGECLFHKDDLGKKIYFIQDGEISVYIPKSDTELSKERASFDETRESFVFRKGFIQPKRNKALLSAMEFLPIHTVKNIAAIPCDKFDPFLMLLISYYKMFDYFQIGEFHQTGFGDISMYFKQNVLLFKEVVVLRKNAFFGELSLARHDQKRAATVSAKKAAHCLSLKKKDFESIFAASIASDNEKFEFFNEILSPELPKTIIIDQHYQFEKKKLDRGTFLFKEGSAITQLFFVKSGDVELTKRIKIGGKYIDRPQFNSCTQDRDMGNNHRITTGYIRPEIIGIVGKGQMIGEDDFLNGYTNCNYSAKAICHPTIIYAIDKMNFQNCSPNFGKFLEVIKKQSMTKKNWRNNHAIDIYENQIKNNIDQQDTPQISHKEILKNIGINNQPPVQHNPKYVNLLKKDMKGNEIDKFDLFESNRNQRDYSMDQNQEINGKEGIDEKGLGFQSVAHSQRKNVILSRQNRNTSSKRNSSMSKEQSYITSDVIDSNIGGLNDIRKAINSVNFKQNDNFIFQPNHMKSDDSNDILYCLQSYNKEGLNVINKCKFGESEIVINRNKDEDISTQSHNINIINYVNNGSGAAENKYPIVDRKAFLKRNFMKIQDLKQNNNPNDFFRKKDQQPPESQKDTLNRSMHYRETSQPVKQANRMENDSQTSVKMKRLLLQGSHTNIEHLDLSKNSDDVDLENGYDRIFSKTRDCSPSTKSKNQKNLNKITYIAKLDKNCQITEIQPQNNSGNSPKKMEKICVKSHSQRIPKNSSKDLLENKSSKNLHINSLNRTPHLKSDRVSGYPSNMGTYNQMANTKNKSKYEEADFKPDIPDFYNYNFKKPHMGGSASRNSIQKNPNKILNFPVQEDLDIVIGSKSNLLKNDNTSEQFSKVKKYGKNVYFNNNYPEKWSMKNNAIIKNYIATQQQQQKR